MYFSSEPRDAQIPPLSASRGISTPSSQETIAMWHRIQLRRPRTELHLKELWGSPLPQQCTVEAPETPTHTYDSFVIAAAVIVTLWLPRLLSNSQKTQSTLLDYARPHDGDETPRCQQVDIKSSSTKEYARGKRQKNKEMRGSCIVIYGEIHTETCGQDAGIYHTIYTCLMH